MTMFSLYFIYDYDNPHAWKDGLYIETGPTFPAILQPHNPFVSLPYFLSPNS